jgi:hypothetical protein
LSSEAIPYLIAFFRAFPAIKPGIFRADMVIASPVRGFLPFLDARDLTTNVPNPVMTTFSPLFSVSRTPSSTAWTASLDALFVRSAFFATRSISSLFVMIVKFTSSRTVKSIWLNNTMKRECLSRGIYAAFGSVARNSRIAVTFTSPGMISFLSTSSFISRAKIVVSLSSSVPGSTMTRSSLPA